MSAPVFNVQWISDSSSMNSANNNTGQSIAVDSAGNTYCAFESTGAIPGSSMISSYSDVVVYKRESYLGSAKVLL